MISLLPKKYPYKVEAYTEWCDSLYFYNSDGELWRYRIRDDIAWKSIHHSIEEIIGIECIHDLEEQGLILGEVNINRYLMTKELLR